MTKIYADILAIIEKATRENALPEGITENNAEYLAEIVRKSTEIGRGGAEHAGIERNGGGSV